MPSAAPASSTVSPPKETEADDASLRGVEAFEFLRDDVERERIDHVRGTWYGDGLRLVEREMNGTAASQRTGD